MGNSMCPPEKSLKGDNRKKIPSKRVSKVYSERKSKPFENDFFVVSKKNSCVKKSCLSNKKTPAQDNLIGSYTPKSSLNKLCIDFGSNDRFKESIKESSPNNYIFSSDFNNSFEGLHSDNFVENQVIKEFCQDNNWFFNPQSPDELITPIELKKILSKKLRFDFEPLTQYDPFKYTGESKDGYRHGYGQLRYNNVEIYSGLFLLDAIHTPVGKVSTIKDIEGAKFFEGNVFLGRKHGLGCIFHRNGEPYCKAMFIDDIIVDKKGQIFSEQTGKLVFQGEMVDGLKNGMGVDYFDFSEDQQKILQSQSHNRILTSAKFIDYKGEFKDDLRSGSGLEYKIDKAGNSYMVCNSFWSFDNKILDTCQYDNSGKLARRAMANNSYLFCVDYSKKGEIKYLTYKNQN